MDYRLLRIESRIGKVDEACKEILVLELEYPERWPATLWDEEEEEEEERVLW